MKFWKIALSTIFAITLFGCAGKYQAPQEFNTTVTDVSKAQVKSAILASGTTGKSTFGTWRMKDVNDNTIQATLFNRGYEIVVNIPYSAKGYSIKYVSASDNLKDKNGNVHRNYNRWVNNLNTKIKQNIFMSN
ncbi:lipoprotein [Orbus sasakiae]|uniref:Lipoprotein n=1 Tax=Orbus sasakiae TaxID=1078475 RepID=A0ABP9NET3_9GAMM